MKFRCAPDWGVVAFIVFLVVFWVCAAVGFARLVFGAGPPVAPLETRIIFDKQTPTIELWQDMGGYKQKVWDNRPGPMQDASEYKLHPFESPTVFEDKYDAPVREQR